MMTNTKWFYEYLACPDCSNSLIFDSFIKCSNCTYCKPVDSIELKPKTPTSLPVKFSRLAKENASDILQRLDLTSPEITYSGPDALRDSRELISQMQQYLRTGDKVLDLGCGPRDQAIPVEYLGFQYVGIDYSNPQADILADAHAIPFRSNTFDCVLSYAVLEHLHNPFIAISEIARVLKPGGVYIGTVSQGEPFHDSYFHHTAWGLNSLITSSPHLQLLRLWPSYDTLASLADMGQYPRFIRMLIGGVEKMHRLLPILAPRKMRWSKSKKDLDQLYRAGSICFVIQKSAEIN